MISSYSSRSKIFRVVVAFGLLSTILWTFSLVEIGREVVHKGDFLLTDDFPAFQDILIYRSRFTLYHTLLFFQTAREYSSFAYPPADAVVYSWLYRLKNPEIFYLVGVALWSLFVAGLLSVSLRPFLSSTRSRLVAALFTMTFCFPLAFLAERANVELYVWMSIFVGMLLMLREKPTSGAAFLGLAAALKLYPLLLLGSFVTRRIALKPILVGLATFLAVTLLALWYAGPNFGLASTGFWQGVTHFKSANGEAPRTVEIIFDHSFLVSLKWAALSGLVNVSRWINLYYATTLTAFGLLYLLRVRFLPWLNRFLFLSIGMITLPPVSYEYTLVHLYAPLFLLLSALLARASRLRQVALPAADLVALGLGLFVMLPLGIVAGGQLRIAGMLQSIALLGLAIATSVVPWPSASGGGAETVTPGTHESRVLGDAVFQTSEQAT